MVNHDMGSAHDGNAVGGSPSVGMKQGDSVQKNGVARSFTQRRPRSLPSHDGRQCVEIDVAMGEHYPLGCVAGAAGVEQFGKRVFIYVHKIAE